MESKKEYVAALSLPVKEVAMAMSNNDSDSKDLLKKSMDYSRSKSVTEIENKSLNKGRSVFSG